MEYKKLSKENISRIVLTKEEFLRNAKESTLFAELHAELNTPESYKRLKQLEHKKNIDYAILCNQIVGAETRYNL